jgi:hypothetical protein
MAFNAVQRLGVPVVGVGLQTVHAGALTHVGILRAAGGDGRNQHRGGQKA